MVREIKTMADARTRNPADLVKYYVDLINGERAKIDEALLAIAEYADQLRRVTLDTHQRMLTRD
jgi:hypothetical protein